MKRSITRWTTTLGTAALLTLPVAATATTQQPYSPPPQQQPAPQPAQPQQPKPQPTEPQPAQPQPAQPQPAQPQPAQPQPTQPQPTDPPATATQQPTATAQPSTPAESPEEHLRQARAAFNDIKMTSIPARNRTEFAELRKHLAALENPSAAAASNRSPKSNTKGAADSANSWGTEVAAIDRLITQLSGSDTATGAPTANTSGATGTTGKGAAASVAVDEATRAKLMEIRTHITAYAAAKSGAASTPRTETMPNETVTSTAQSGNATAGETPRTGNYATEGQPATTSPQTPSPSAQTPSTSPQGAAAVAPKVDTEAAHRSLLAARDSLNQLTQLPAAAQLSGETRTQVQQLISEFNELITNTTDWRSSYTKVSATLTTLLGADNTDAQATAAQTPTAPTPTTGAAGTTGAVGTSGTATTQLDPAIRAKLVEMKNNLAEFEKASGGMSK